MTGLMVKRFACAAAFFGGQSALLATENDKIFRDDIEAVLRSQCASCHTGANAGGGLQVGSLDQLLRGGKRGSAIHPGDSKGSLLLQFIRGEQTPQMPMGGKLPVEAVTALAAAIDRMQATATPGPADPHVTWLFNKPKPPAIPIVQNKEWVRNPIDAFILARLEAQGMTPAPKASRRALIRRLYFDLIGLPPPADEVQAFEKDSAPDAYDKVVDRLLADARYSERWARHWLDLARYADTDGFAVDKERALAWRYRDYVIRSFRDDKPYDMFIKEQLAGDEMKSNPDAKIDSFERIVALGFLRNGPWLPDANFQTQNRQDFLDEVTGTTGSVFLGLTLGCARCHDHKYDPLPHKDYYRIQAFFAATRHAERPAPYTKEENPRRIREMVRKLEDDRDAAAEEFKRLEDALKLKYAEAKNLKPGDRAINQGFTKTIGDAKEPTFSADERKAYKAARERTFLIEDALPRLEPMAYAVADLVAPDVFELPDTFVLAGGDLGARGENVEAGFLRCVVGKEEPANIKFVGKESSGRRLALAEWIASADNPLTARVMTNRIWQHHFGEGIVRTPSDFGISGDRPSHPELLDWLALQFVEKKWSIKAMHRLMLTSNTYRQATSHPDAKANAGKDSENRLFWRMNWLRLEAEVVRDSLLSLSGAIQQSPGGPGVYFKSVADLAASFPQFRWIVSPAKEQGYRSIYGFQRRSMVMPMLEALDVATMSESCSRRQATTVAPQALSLLNSEFVNEQAKRFAERVIELAGPDPEARVTKAFWLALGRAPAAEQLEKGKAFLSSSRSGDGLGQFSVVLFNLNEFLYLE